MIKKFNIDSGGNVTLLNKEGKPEKFFAVDARDILNSEGCTYTLPVVEDVAEEPAPVVVPIVTGTKVKKTTKTKKTKG